MITLLLALSIQDFSKDRAVETLPADADLKSLVFSPAGNGIAYRAFSEGKWHAVLNGQKGEPFDGVDEIVFSPSGAAVAYKVNKGGKATASGVSGGRWAVFWDGKCGEEFAFVKGVTVSPDGKSIAFAALQGMSTWHLVVGDKKTRTFENAEPGPPVFSADSSTVGCAVSDFSGAKHSEYAVWGGQTSKKYDRVGPPVMSADGHHTVFYAQQGEAWFAVFDERESEKYDEMFFQPSLSPAGDVVAYGGRRKDECWFVYGAKGYINDDIKAYAVFSPDGKKTAYVEAGPTACRVRLGDKRGRDFALVGVPKFSPDDSTLAYGAQNSFGWCVVAGGKQSVYFERVGGIVFSKDGKKAGFFGLKKRDVMWKVMEVVP